VIFMEAVQKGARLNHAATRLSFFTFAKKICSTMYLKTAFRLLLQGKNSTLKCLLGAIGFASMLACETPQNTVSVADRPSASPVQADTTYEGEKVYEMFHITKPPSFPGGDMELSRHLNISIDYPSKARIMGTQGTVVVSFIVTKVGEIKNVKIIRDIGNGCGEEAVRVFQAMPNWVPGESFGNRVHVRMVQPVRFNP